MNKGFEAQIQLQMVWHTNDILSKWQQQIAGNRHLQLGSDLQLVQAIEKDLTEAEHQIQRLDSHFDIRTVPIEHAKIFFVTKNRIKKAKKLMAEIRREAFGSSYNTHLCLEHLTLCTESIRTIGQTLANQVPHAKYSA